MLRHDDCQYSTVIINEILFAMYSTTLFIYNAPKGLLDKLQKLFEVLTEEKSKCEIAASTITNKQMNRSLALLVQETNQYANELGCQIKSLGGEINEYPKSLMKNGFQSTSTNEVFDYCLKSEKKIIKMYREILNESLMLSGVRNMIQYQLNGLLSAFLQLKMLNASLMRK
jgi:rubrerythrin